MRLLLDENVPRPLHQVLTTFVLNHDIVHLLDLPGWSGTRDETLMTRADVMRAGHVRYGRLCGWIAGRRAGWAPGWTGGS